MCVHIHLREMPHPHIEFAHANPTARWVDLVCVQFNYIQYHPPLSQ